MKTATKTTAKAVRAIARRLVDQRLECLLEGPDDFLTEGVVGSEGWPTLLEAVVRWRGFKEESLGEAEAGFILGVEVGRRIGRAL